MSNLVDIQNQIETLKKQAAEIRAQDFDVTVQEIREKMQAFGITSRDLNPNGEARKYAARGTVKKRAANGTRKGSGVPVAAKYRGPEGQGWSGRGLTPRWMATLIAQGRTKEEFAIAPSQIALENPSETVAPC